MSNKFIPVIFDTSTWVLLVNHQESVPAASLGEYGIRPIITMEIVLELMNVSKEFRLKRLDYLKRVPNLSTLSYKAGKMGSFVDLRCLEYESLLNNEEDRLEYFLGNISPVSMDTIASIEASDFDDFLEQQRARYLILSQSFWKVYNNPSMREVRLEDITLRSNMSEDDFQRHVEKTVMSMLLNADKKRPKDEITQAVKTFADSMWAVYRGTRTGSNPISEAMAKLGIDIDKMAPSTTLGGLIEEIEYRTKLSQISENTSATIDQLLVLDRKKITSWQIEQEFRKTYEDFLHKNSQRKSESSYITDKHIACFSYVFPVIVDKRTREILDIVKLKIDDKLSYYHVNSVESLLELMRKLTSSST